MSDTIQKGTTGMRPHVNSVDASGSDNAMTEVALALAMGFFSLMVLTLVSMGSGDVSNDTSKTEPAEFDVLEIVASKPSSASPQTVSGRNSGNDRFILLFNGQFFDRSGDVIDPSTVSPVADGRLILVVDPSNSFSSIVDAKARLGDQNAIVAEMTQDWMKALQERESKQ